MYDMLVLKKNLYSLQHYKVFNCLKKASKNIETNCYKDFFFRIIINNCNTYNKIKYYQCTCKLYNLQCI